jgi:YihY family inner membrane protein
MDGPSPQPDGDAGPDAAPTGLGARVEGRLRRLDSFQQRHRPLAVTVGVFKKFGDDQAGNLAALVSYYTFFSLFPLLLLLTTIVAFVLHDDPAAQQTVVNSVLDRFPGFADQLASNIGEFQGSGIAVVVGALGALWAGLGALGAMQNAMNTIWAVPFEKRPPFLVERARSLLMLLVLGSGAIATTVITNVASSLEGLPMVARVLVVAATLLLNIGLFLLAFKVLTRHGIDWRQLLPGAVVAGIVFLILQSVGGWYISRTLGRAAPLYGTFAVVLGLLTWLYIQAQLTMLAAELNVVLARHMYPRSLVGTDLADLTGADARALASYAAIQQRHPNQQVSVTFEPHAAGPAAELDAAADAEITEVGADDAAHR